MGDHEVTCFMEPYHGRNGRVKEQEKPPGSSWDLVPPDFLLNIFIIISS